MAKSHQWFDDSSSDLLQRFAESRARSGDAADRRSGRRLPAQLLGFPRHLSQHSGGFVISRGKLTRLVPVENAAMADRSVIQWDKDDLEALGLLKIDVLALGMLSAIRRTLDIVSEQRGERFEMQDIPAEDPATYEMISQADTVGVFQIESRAQMTMLPRLQPRDVLRPRDRGRDRAARADSGRHGASLSAPAAGARAGHLPERRARRRRSDARWACRSSRSR